LNARRIAKYAYLLKNIRPRLNVIFKDATVKMLRIVSEINAKDCTHWIKADYKDCEAPLPPAPHRAMNSSAPLPTKDCSGKNGHQAREEPDTLAK